MKNLKKRPLKKSVAYGCVLFAAILCLVLSVLNYFNEKKALFTRYEAYISDLLHFLETQIDDEDVKHCIETGVESPSYQRTLRFMDEIMNSYNIHYLYVDKPLNLNETGNVMCVFSAKDDSNRYENSEGNLYLGWISEDEFEIKTVEKYFEIMQHDAGEVEFFESKTAWGYDYTGAIPLKDAAGESYAIMGVDVDITEISSELLSQFIKNFIVILVLSLLFTIAFLTWAKHNVTEPIQQLEKGVVDFAARSHGQHDLEALSFEAPEIRVDNELKSLSTAITQMTQDMQNYVTEILSAEEKTEICASWWIK